MELTVQISDLDYDSVAERLIPILEEQLDGSFLGNLPFFPNGIPVRQAAGLIQRLPQAQKDAMLALYVNRNQEKIAAKLERFAAEQGVSVKVGTIKVNRREE